ncbi:MAG: PIN domain-containing protein [Candidatus Lokiarchaeota archaeon]|nr:PIN domain-containing protein [Candidatus Lokiarchaeota archaeon]
MRIKKKVYFLDTNIIWWYLVKNSKYHKPIKTYLDKLIIDTQNSFMVNEFVMIELFHLLIKKKGNEGFKIASMLLNKNYPFFIIKYDLLQYSDLESVLTFLKKYGNISSIGGRDSTIIYSMKVHEVEDIITNDKGFEEVDSIKIHNPI